MRRLRPTSGLRPLLALGLLALAAPPAAAQGSDRAVVTAAAQVTANPAPVRAHSSPQMARNPRTEELVVVSADVRGSLRCDVHISVDDGRSWFAGGDPMPQAHPVCAPGAEYGPYASVAFGADGALFVAFTAGDHLLRGRDSTPRHLYLARSADSGRTFSTTRVFEAPEGNPDRGLNKGPTLAVDPSDSDNVYVGWRQGVFRDAREKLKSNIAASRDGGRTFGPPVDVTDDRGGDFPWISVDGDGVVHAVYWTRTFPPIPFDQPNPVRPIQYVRSTDQGRTFSPGMVIDPGNQQAFRPPALAADPRSRAVYVAWYSNPEPDNQREGLQSHLEVFFVASRDGGRTWGERRVLNDDRGAAVPASQFFPGLSIAPNGRVDVAWYDGRLSPVPPSPGTGEEEAGFQDVFYTSSDDQGASFRPNRRITDRSMDRSIGVWSNNIDSSHNVALASTDDAVYLAWQDSRNADRERQPEDVYAASVRLDGPAPVEARQSTAPRLGFLGAGLAIGLALGMGAAWLAATRRWGPAA